MKNLIETILWLSRRGEEVPLAKEMILTESVDRVLNENRYLLQGKKVTLKVDVFPSVIRLPETPF